MESEVSRAASVGFMEMFVQQTFAGVRQDSEISSTKHSLTL